MTAKTITFRSADGLMRLLAGLSKEASEQLREAAFQLTDEIATDAANRAYQMGGVASLVAPSITGRRDRVPSIKLGNSSKLPTVGTTQQGGYYERKRRGPNQTIGALIFGAEFGGGRRPSTTQFLPWRGNDSSAGYFLYPAVRAHSDDMAMRYWEAVVSAIDVTARSTKGK